MASSASSQTTLPHFLHLSDLDDKTLFALLKEALQLKKEKHRSLSGAGKLLAMLFFNPSLRTRVSFETAALHFGAGTSVIQPGEGVWAFETQKGVRMDGSCAEHLKEAVQVMSRYADALGVRVFAAMKNLQDDLKDRLLHDIADYATVPVINMESACEHPCQALADGLTLLEHFNHQPKDKKFVLSWAPHPNPLPMAVPASALEIAARLGMKVTLACPAEMVLSEKLLKRISLTAEKNGNKLEIVHNQADAFQGADIIYGKSWGAPLLYTNPDKEKTLRTETHSGWTIDEKCMSKTHNAAFMHCLPVRRNVVVTDTVLDSPAAIHIPQAENRLHVQKALLKKIWQLP